MVQRRGAAINIAGLRKEYISGQGCVVAIDTIDLSVSCRNDSADEADAKDHKLSTARKESAAIL